jgi:hypothetical protein
MRHLTGLLPLCSYCKHVRTDKNDWEQIEHYVAGHSDLQFSHAICPPCYDRVSAGIDGRVKTTEGEVSVNVRHTCGPVAAPR